MDMSRKVNKYFVARPVSSWEDAKLIGSETNWRILETLRDAGVSGLSVEEVSKSIEVPKSSVYSILNKLEAGGWVESSIRRLHWGRPKKEAKQRFGGKPTKVFIEKIFWGVDECDEDFASSLESVLRAMGKDVDELKIKWLSILEKITSAYQTTELEEFFPHDQIHEECGESHEGIEFLYAISSELLRRILKGEKFSEFARKHKFMK
jgi:transposase